MKRLLTLQQFGKTCWFALLLIVTATRFSSGEEQVDPEYVKGLEERTRLTKERMAEIARRAKPEEGIVAYIVLDGDKLAPAFLNSTLRTLHRWEGVILKVSDVPVIHGWPTMELGGPMIIWPEDLRKLAVKPIAPPVRYVQLDDGRFVRGYYDHTSQVLYQNPDSFLSESELPPDAVAGKLLIDRSFFGHCVKLLDGSVLRLDPIPQKRKSGTQTRRRE